MGKFKDIMGRRFGRLIALERVGKDKHRRSIWRCECECGNVVEVPLESLTRGYTKDCGKHMRYRNHGLTNTSLYNSYSAMKQRCCNPKSAEYEYYGGRGIKITNEWIDNKNGIVNFFKWAINNGYKEGLTLDRIDVNGNYCPENCRWVNKGMQSFNQRQRKSKFGVRGVYYREKTNRYLASIGFEGKNYFLGSFRSADEAIAARRKAELEYYGKVIEY